MAMIDPQNYFRLPFTLTDNALSWLEVTTACNLHCEGCYRDTRSAEGHKSLEEISAELDVFARERKSDAMSLAGGDPLVHPQIVEIISMISQRGWKPIINTNGELLTPELLRQLKRAGVYGFTFHIDTSQKRRDAPGVRTEAELNALRLKLARMLAAEGGICCAFNQTVTEDTLAQVPDVVRWAQQHPDIVHTVVFIIYREPDLLRMGDYDFFAAGKKIPVKEHYKDPKAWGGRRAVKAPEVIEQIRSVDPHYEPCAYLGGTANPRSTKWLLGNRLANRRRGFGYYSPRVMEILQYVKHAFTGTWLAYSRPEVLASGRMTLAGFALVDPQIRAAAWRFLRNGLRRPRELFQRVYMQSLLVIQPIDLLEDGRADMCDGCPDITVHKGKLFWSCRLEEIKHYGHFVTAQPRTKDQSAEKAEGTRQPEPVHASPN
ncbi:MAG: radical SAM protein [Deltaproteobacteria bacterium]|nr:radical SAM protein [Deltaproteobacteria bacterium]